jgi:hypothetical protein
MSYYDDYDDECSSEDDIFYHNYSVDYANQILGGHHAISSCLPLTRRKHREYSPQLVRVSTLDQMPVVNRHQILPSVHSRPTYGNDVDIASPSFNPPRLPTLEATSEELERRATGRTQPIPQVNILFCYQKFMTFFSIEFCRSHQTFLRHLQVTIIRRLMIHISH